MADIQKRLEALVALGYQVGVGAQDGEGKALSYRLAGFGVDLTIPVKDAGEYLDALEASHADREAEAAKTDEERQAELDANAEKVEQRRADLVAKINASNLPAGVKAILEELAEAALTR